MEGESSMHGSNADTSHDWFQCLSLAEQEETVAYCDWLHDQAKLNEWKQAQRARTAGILATLRRHLRPDECSEVLRFLENGFCRDCIGAALVPEPQPVKLTLEAQLFRASPPIVDAPF
jgi:hypothetical protein